MTNGLRVSEVCAALVELLEREPDGGLSLQVNGKGGKLSHAALNERIARVVAGGRERGVLFEPQDRRRTRHGHDAPRIPYTQLRASRERLCLSWDSRPKLGAPRHRQAKSARNRA